MSENESRSLNLSEQEIREVKRILTKAKQDEIATTNALYNEKLDNVRAKVRWALKELVDRCASPDEYRDAEYVGDKGTSTILRWRDGRALGFGFGGAASGALGYFYQCFKEWGFESVGQFYDLPRVARHAFCDSARSIVEAYAGPNMQGIRDLQNKVEQEADYERLQQLYAEALKASYIIKAEWVELAKKAKKAEKDNPSLGARIKKMRARIDRT
jgi:hypothetical protein